MGNAEYMGEKNNQNQKITPTMRTFMNGAMLAVLALAVSAVKLSSQEED